MRSSLSSRRRQLTLHESLSRASKEPYLDRRNSEYSSTDMTSNASGIFSNPDFTWQNLDAHSVQSALKPIADAGFSVTNLYETEGNVEFSSASSEYTDAWNASYVKLPCSPQNLYYENEKSVSRWSLIEKALSAPITSVKEFATAVLSYNARFVDSWNFDHLSAALQIEPRYLQLLPKIAVLALKLPHLITRPIPLLLRDQEASVSLSQLQIACLLANAFYCTFPYRNTRSQQSEYSNFPFINFGVLMYRNQSRSTDHKVLCILHYFSRVFSGDPPGGIVTYTRRRLNQSPDFVSSDAKFKSIAFGVSSTCLIEDADPETFQVNFANRFLGGGVLRGGCVQEEILCCIRPEILAGLLFIEAMDDHEALIIEGAERFSRYTGYGATFKWAGDFNEAVDGKNARDKDGRWMGAITAIDALPFARDTPQFEGKYIRRELDKAYSGFTDLLAPYRALPNVVVSGHWGCGLIQMMACAQAGKSLAYCTFSDDDFAKKALQVFQILCSSSCTGKYGEYCLLLVNQSVHLEDRVPLKS
ncbi:Poly ADP-ribose glycohydrolase [Taenia solium]|eukprot:TsM_000537900 transcript=TsM_000537900 gene=TsM_000537900